MSDFSALIASVESYIRQNGNNEITGNILQEVLVGIINTLGTQAINALETGLSTEQTTRANADTALGNRIDTADGNISSLSSIVTTLQSRLDEGYIYKGIATPTTNPSTPTGKVFYVATQAGTYTNFGGLTVDQGVNILKYNGIVWSLEQVIGLDDSPTPSSGGAVRSGGVFEDLMTNGSAFDLTEHNSGTTYADITAALTAMGELSASYRKGGMSIKFVQTSDNRYVQYRYTGTSISTADFTDASNWEYDVTKKDISEDFLGLLPEVKDYVTKNFIIVASGKFGSNTAYKHAVIPVNVGDVYYLVGETKNCRAAFVTSDESSAGGDVPYVSGTNYIPMPSAGQYYKVVVPEGSVYMLLNIGTDYGGRCFRHYDTLKEGTDEYTDDSPSYESENLITSGGVFGGMRDLLAKFSLNSVFRDASVFFNGNGGFYHTPLDEGGYEDISYISYADASWVTRSKGIRLTGLKAEGYNKITVYANPYNDAYVTFITRNAGSSPTSTFSELKASGLLSMIHSDSAAFVVTKGTTRTFDIPEDCEIVFFTGVNVNQESVGYPTASPYRIPERIEVIRDVVNKILYTEANIDVRHYPFYNRTINGQGVIATGAFSVCIPLYNTRIVRIFTGGEGSRINFLKEPISSGSITPATGYVARYEELPADSEIVKAVPDDAKYLFVHISATIGVNMYSDRLCPKSITFISDRKDEDSKDYGFVVGNIGIDGFIHDDDYYAASGFVDLSRGFYVKFNDEYKIYASHLYDMNGNIVAYDYLPPTTDGFYSYPYALQDYSMYSIAFSIPYKLRLVVTRRDGQEITDVHNIIKSFVYLDDGRLQLESPDFPLENYRNFLSRIRQLSACLCNPQAYFPTAITSQSGTTDMNWLFFRKNQYRAGVTYSLNAQLSKAVGMEVSMRTYLSAIANKNSVMYTENLNTNTSKYGISYTSMAKSVAVAYYGVVCTSFVCYALNINMFYRSGSFKDGYIPNTQVIDNVNGNTVKVGDLIWNEGHCSVISQIYNDNTGKRCLIVWAEQTKPTPYITAMTPQEFDNRLAHYNYGQADAEIQVLRFSDWQSVDTPCNFEGDISLSEYFDTNKIMAPVKDIQSFAGDYACFADGDPLFFNINISKGYTKFQVFDQSDTLVDEVDISVLQPFVIYSNDEDWGRLDYTANNLSGGLYKARCINENDNSISEYTYFEKVAITFSITKSGSTYNCTFSCSGNASPYLLRKEDALGYEPWPATDYMPLDGTETQASLQWTITSTYKYIKLLCKGHYGVAVKKINAYIL